MEHNIIEFSDEEIALPDEQSELDRLNDMFKHTPNGRIPATLEDRVSQCGKLRHRIDPRNGKLIGYYQDCEQREFCKKCKGNYAEKEMEKVLAACPDGKVKLLITDNGKGFTRGVDSSKYKRYPLLSGNTAILHLDEEADGQWVNVEDIDWEQLVMTPKGKNVSGKLHKNRPMVVAADKEDKGPSKNVLIESIIVEDVAENRDDEMTKDEFKKLWELAVLETLDLDPDLQSLNKAIKKRMTSFKSYVEAAGYAVTFSVYDWHRVYESELDWSPYNGYIRKKYQRELEEEAKLKEADRVVAKVDVELQQKLELVDLGQPEPTPF